VIHNHQGAAVSAKLQAEIAANNVVGDVTRALEAAHESFEIAPDAAGLEVAARSTLVNGLPNRARMKVFSPRPGHTLVFFFKTSQVPYSRDRYSYGGVDIRASSAKGNEIAGWIDFLNSGFHPDKRPENLRRAFPYEIP
jgi:hypothetical protein